MKILVIGKSISDKNTLDYINIVIPLTELGHLIKTIDLVDDQKLNQFNIDALCKNIFFDLIFIIPVENELDLSYIKELSKNFKSLVYFYDDTWRIEYSKDWSKAVKYVVTSDINWKINFNQNSNKIIYSSFFINTNVYKPINENQKKYDVTFVGQYHPSREWIINLIKKSGVDIKVFGKGWYEGSEISHNEMIEIFNQSKINLNLSNSINYDIRHLLDFKNNKFISLLKSYKLIFKSLYMSDMKIFEMVKARFFEINACQGFQISFYAQGLEHQYMLGEEVEIFENPIQLIRKIHFYLNNEELRCQIAKNGYEKCIKYHDSKIRLNHILSQIKLDN